MVSTKKSEKIASGCILVNLPIKTINTKKTPKIVANIPMFLSFEGKKFVSQMRL